MFLAGCGVAVRSASCCLDIAARTASVSLIGWRNEVVLGAANLEARFVNARNVREAMSAQRRLPQRPSRRASSSASVTVSSAVGTASRRSSAIGSPLWTERP